MKTQTYWSEQRVYFFARAAYFPERLIDELLESNEIVDYFPQGYGDYLSLQDVTDNLVRIVNINQTEFILELREYVRAFHTDQLSTQKKIKPVHYGNLLQRLFRVVMSKKDESGTRPVIDLTDLWPERSERQDGATPFWEFILAESALGDNTIELINIGYEGEYVTSDGTKKTMPYAEIHLIFGSVMYQAVMHISPLRKVKADANNSRVELRKNGLAVVRGDEEVLLNRLKPGGQYYNFAEYLVKVQDAPISLMDVKEDVEGAKAAENLGELARYAGFDKYDKGIFFDYIDSGQLKFKPKLHLTAQQFNDIKNRRLNRKQIADK